MAKVIVHAEKVIARPLDIVRAQFTDMQHHSSTGVHSQLNVSNVRPQENGCRFTARRRVFGKLQEDEIEVVRGSDGNSTLRSIAGTNAGLVISQSFEAVDAGRTRVRLTTELPVHGVLGLLAPLVRLGLKKDVESALEEDRVDLEERGYPRA